MKILQVIDTYGNCPNDNYSVGTFRVMDSLISSLSSNGHHVGVVSDRELPKNYNVEYYYDYTYDYRSRYYIGELIKKSIEIYDSNNYDIIHIHVGKLSVWKYIAECLASRSDINVVYTLHSVVDQGRASFNLINYAKNFTGNSNIRVVSPSKYQLEEYLKYIDMTDTNCSVIYNSTSKADRVLYSDKIYDIVFCGRLTMMKNSAYCIDFIRNNPQYRYAYIGVPDCNGSKSSKEYTEYCIKELKDLTDASDYSIDWYSTPMSNKSVLDIISKSKYLISLSYQETFGLSVVEALSSGVPTLSVLGGAVPEVLEDKGYYIDFKPRTKQSTRIKELSNKVADLMNITEKEYDELASTLESYWSTKFSDDTMYNEYLKVYNELLDRSNYE